MAAKPTTSDDTNLPEFVTRRGLIELVRRRLGAPLTRGKLNKALREGKGPEPAGRWGNADLFNTVVGLDWARSLVTHRAPGEQKLIPEKNATARTRAGSSVTSARTGHRITE
jgi:hypothetical protein